MSDANFQIKIGVETQLTQLKAMEAQFERQIVQLRTLGTGGADALKKVETNLGLVRAALVNTASVSGTTGAVAGGAFKNIGQTIGQAGYQMQDFAVQVAGGQSALTAFAQQGSQLLGIFGPTGIVAGAVLAVGALAIKMIGVGTATEETTSKFKTQREAILALIKAERERAIANDPSKAASYAAADTDKSDAAYQAQKAKMQATRAELKKAIETRDARQYAGSIGGIGGTMTGDFGGASARQAQGRVDTLQAKLDVEIKKAIELKAALTEVVTVQEQIDKGDAEAVKKRTDEAAAWADEAEAGREALAVKIEAGRIEAINKAETEALKQDELDIKDALDAQVRARKQMTSSRDNDLAIVMNNSQAELAKIEANRFLIDEQKAPLRIAALNRENAAIDERIRLLLLEKEITPGGDQSKLIEQLRKQRVGNDGKIDENKPYVVGERSQISAAKVSADNDMPNTLGRGADMGLSATINQFGTDAQIVAGGIQASFQGAFQGISTSLQGLIEGTMTWGDALRNIGSTIMNSIIGAIADMFAAWLVGRAAQGLASIAWHKAETSNVIKDEASALPVKTAGAAAAGISSYGFAVLGGIAALALIAAVAFKDGGPVSGAGTGTSDSIPAWLSNGEYVMPASKTAQYRPLLDSMRAGTLNPGQLAGVPGPGGGAAVQAGGNTQINIGLMGHMSPQQWAESQAGESHIVDIVSRNIHKISGNG